ncbi:hypothetical protein SCFA_890031 [anaerobic digester metagenome]|uniref:Uncharacterized protein n=1 Tax=anaerobic digester metagenome TaxID=1263854 RepID=A0A485M5I9_9ZZZZ
MVHIVYYFIQYNYLPFVLEPSISVPANFTVRDTPFIMKRACVLAYKMQWKTGFLF